MKDTNWISVLDQLPEHRQRILCFGLFDMGVGKQIYLARFNAEDELGLNNYSFIRGGEEIFEVTHWMPLPETPES